MAAGTGLEIDAGLVDDLALGGAVLGGGGGGSIHDGRRLGREALARGTPRLISLGDLSEDALVATVSAVGAPAARNRHVAPGDFIEAVERLAAALPTRLAGVISSENGGSSSVNGLLQSAACGLPVVDAPCNGRAHPTGVMGSMALGARPGFVSRQVAVGGDPAHGRIVCAIEGPLGQVDRLVRQAAVEAGGMVAVARNPVEASYLRQHAAPGALTLAIELGRIVRRQASGRGTDVAAALADRLNGTVLGAGRIRDLQLETAGGYDVGALSIDDIVLTFWNEYMTAERAGLRLATFPDLLTTIDVESGLPCTTAALRTGQDVVLLFVPRQSLPLGAGMRDVEALRAIEPVIRRPVVSFLTF